MLPRSFPPWKTVYGYFRRLSQKGIWQQVLAELVKEKGIRQGRNPSPSRLLMDAQRVKTAAKGASRVFDGGNQGKEEANYSRYARQRASGACSWG